jgi:hypothetical protein
MYAIRNAIRRDAQNELYCFRQRAAEAKGAIVPEPEYNTETPQGKRATFSGRR